MTRYSRTYLSALAYMALIFVLSIRPMPAELPNIWQIDKVYHFAAYAVMGALWVRALGAKGKGARIIIVASIISALFGAFVEVCQAFTPTREASLLDALANGAGGVFGAFIFTRLNRRKEA